MAFVNKPFELINEEDLQRLITNGISEDKSLEYKLILPGNSDNDRKEFLGDVLSFANSTDGFIIYGMEEDQGLPTSLPGMLGLDMDREILRLENMVQNGIAPRIPGISLRSISLSNGASALVMRIPKSWISPHMVTLGGSSRFYSRNSAGKYQLDVNEIRSAFLATDALSNRIREFRLDRINKVLVGDTPMPLPVGAKMILHLIPISNFLSPIYIDLSAAEKNYLRLPIIYTADLFTPSIYRINMDGLVTYRGFRDGSIPSYTQLFRNGIIESVDHSLLSYERDDKPRIPSITFEKAIIDTCSALLGFQKASGIEPPIVIFLTLVGVKGYHMAVGFELVSRFGPIKMVDREVIQTPDILIEDYETVVLDKVLRPIFDAVWNAAGWVGSIDYDDDGSWSDKKQR